MHRLIAPFPNSGCCFLSFVNTRGSFSFAPSLPSPPSSGVAGTNSFVFFALALEDLLNDPSPSLVPVTPLTFLGLFLVPILLILLSPIAVPAGDSILTVFFFFFPFLSTSPSPKVAPLLVLHAPTVAFPSIVRFRRIPCCCTAAGGGGGDGDGDGADQCLKDERDCQSCKEGEGDLGRSLFEGESDEGTVVE